MKGEKIILTNKEISVAWAALHKIQNMPLQPRTGYWLGRNHNALLPICERIAKELHEIIKKHGTATPDGSQIMVPPTIEVDGKQEPNPVAKLCQDEMDALNAKEIEITIHKLPLSGFMGTISMADINALNFMIEEEAESNLIQLPKPRIV